MLEASEKICLECGEPIPKSDKHELCKVCRQKAKKAKRKEWWSKYGPFVVLGLSTAVAVIGTVVDAILSKNQILSDDCSFTTDDDSEGDSYPIGEKYWNKEKQRWEKDGKPYFFRVGWTDVRDGEHYEKLFGDIDYGYEVFEDKKKLWFTKDVTWDHIPPDEAGGREELGSE